MTRIVVDASAVIAVVVNESHRDALIAATRGVSLISPASLPWEIGNAFSAMFKQGRISLEDAQAALAEAERVPIQLVEPSLAESLRVAHEFAIYAYDAYMIISAQQFRCPLLTLDRGLRTAALKADVQVMELPQ
jgi:predicted nucleic acid-binding protein